MDIQELKIDEISTDSINVIESSNSGGKKSVNFGPGADLLMNHSRKEKDKTKTSSGIDDLDSLTLDIDSTLGNDNKKSIKALLRNSFEKEGHLRSFYKGVNNEYEDALIVSRILINNNK